MGLPAHPLTDIPPEEKYVVIGQHAEDKGEHKAANNGGDSGVA